MQDAVTQGALGIAPLNLNDVFRPPSSGTGHGLPATGATVTAFAFKLLADTQDQDQDRSRVIYGDRQALFPLKSCAHSPKTTLADAATGGSRGASIHVAVAEGLARDGDRVGSHISRT